MTVTTTVRKMPSFKYGSRVIENEQQIRLERHVRRIGNLLHAVVRFFVTFFLFVLINFLLSNFVQHTNLTFVKMFQLVHQNAEVLFEQSMLSAVTSFTYQHSFCIILAVAFSCVYQFVPMLSAIGNSCGNSEKETESFRKDSQESDTEKGNSTVWYRHKVCFLS